MAWVAFNAPHTPFHIPPTNLHSYGANPATNLLKYRAAVEAMDTEIGRLLLSVNAATTDIIFIGDNGTPGQVIQAPYDAAHAKDTLYEGGIRVPLIIKGPSVVSGGRTSNALVHAVDLFSTMLELAGVPLPTTVTLDSKSLIPILSNDSRHHAPGSIPTSSIKASHHRRTRPSATTATSSSASTPAPMSFTTCSPIPRKPPIFSPAASPP